MKALLLEVALVCVVTMHAAPASAEDPTLDEVRAATDRFRDIEVALAEGYVRDPADVCETAEMMGRPAALGAMGVHYFRPDLLGISAPPDPRVDGVGTHVDFLRPGILIYEPQADGRMELVAVENLVFARAWQAAGHDRPPSFRGISYDNMRDDPATRLDEAHNFEPHFDLHVWLYRDNPNGVFAQFNPQVSCRHHRGATNMAHGGHGGHGAAGGASTQSPVAGLDRQPVPAPADPSRTPARDPAS